MFYREICFVVAQSPHEVDIRFLPQGLHNYGRQGMQEGIGRALAEIDQDRYDAILLGYGLCNNGVTELEACKIPLVVPRAHDCLAVFMGSREKYNEYFSNNPGTFYLTSGWIERIDDSREVEQLSLQTADPMMGWNFEQLVEKYGEKNARYIQEKLSASPHYRQVTYIEMGIEPDDQFEKHARSEADKKSWKFDKLKGDLRLFRQLVDGQWDEADFLVV
ncbi:MAG: DUF1638 domain-containing protein, partial [Proteobacteria bacterium]|nr:DUF1638 domain-containing protein [Pseudomonadota bacterium]